jgi:hypothetical protein
MRDNVAMNQFSDFFEHIKVHGKDLGAKISELIHEGNVRRIIVRNEQGHTFMEIPLTVATVGVIAAPVLAAVAAIAGLVGNFTLVVERDPHGEAARPAESPRSTDPSVGATEDKVNMARTVSQTHNEQGGTGQPDAEGG